MNKRFLITVFGAFLACSILTGCTVDISIDPEELATQVGQYMEAVAEESAKKAAAEGAAEKGVTRADTAEDNAEETAGEDAAAEEAPLNITLQDIYDANKMSNILKHKESCKIQILYNTVDNSASFLYNDKGRYYTECPGYREVTIGNTVYGYKAETEKDPGYYNGCLLGSYQDQIAKYIDENQMFELETIFIDELVEIRDGGNNTVEVLTKIPDEDVREELGEFYEEGMQNECLYVCEKDTNIINKIVATTYDRDGQMRYESTILVEFNTGVPEGMQELIDKFEDPDNSRVLTIVAEPDTDKEETIVLHALKGEPFDYYSLEEFNMYNDRECTEPAEANDYINDRTIYVRMAGNK